MSVTNCVHWTPKQAHLLNPSSTVLRRRFIGQSSGKAGKGAADKMSQADQKAVVRELREGRFNVLVATCIAEEGLDIPQVGASPPWPHELPESCCPMRGAPYLLRTCL